MCNKTSLQRLKDSQFEKADYISLFAVVAYLQDVELEQCRDCYCREFYASILDGNQHSMYLVRIVFRGSPVFGYI